MSKFNFQEIREKGDRSFTMLLVNEIAQGQLDELAELWETLSVLDDPRSLAPLSNLLLDLSQPHAIRQAASDALCGCSTLDTADERKDWWQSGDPVLMRHAIRVAERKETELVVMVASDPTHPFYIDAIGKFEGWEEPRFQKLIINALAHKEADVREVAARALLWEQPVAAETTLLKLAGDAANEDVAVEAMDVLCYCASKEILLTLNDLRHNGPESLRENYERVYAYVAKEFGWKLQQCWASEEAKIRFLTWVAPVKHLIALEETEESKSAEVCTDLPKDQEAPEKPNKFVFSAAAIIDDLSDADGKWYEKTYRYYSADIWDQIEPSQRQGLLKFLREHCDPLARDIACRASAHWQDNNAMLELLNDPNYGVRKSAAYYSLQLEPNKEIGDRLWGLLACDDTTGYFASEALESYLFHAANIDQKHLLLEFALNDSRTRLKAKAISLLDAKSEIERLIPLLSEDPFNTWCIHIAILLACWQSSIPLPHLDHLQSVDNLWLQSTLAEVGVAQ